MYLKDKSAPLAKQGPVYNPQYQYVCVCVCAHICMYVLHIHTHTLSHMF